MKEKMSIHDKAIRLLEGGIVEVDGHCVKYGGRGLVFRPCFKCKMDCLCHNGTEMAEVCAECDSITGHDCFLVLVEYNGNK